MSLKCPSCSAEVPAEAYVSKERFNEVNNSKKQLEQANRALEAKAGQVEVLQTELAQTREKHGVDLALIDAGITDPDVRAVVELAHSRLPVAEGGTKPSIPEWVGGWKTSPDQVPQIVRPFLQQAKPAAAAATTPAPNTGAAPPKKAEAPASGASSSPSAHQPGSLRALRQQGGLAAAQAGLDAAMSHLGLATEAPKGPTGT